jgi:hypothetical protein
VICTGNNISISFFMQRFCFRFHDINTKLAVTDIRALEAPCYGNNVIFAKHAENCSYSNGPEL